MNIFKLVSLLLATFVLGGCAPTRLAMRPLNYNVDVQLDPHTHLLAAEVSIELSPTASNADSKRSRLELLLHPDLEIQTVEVQGATLQSHKQRTGKSDEGSVKRPTVHRLILKDMTDTLAVTLTYQGELHQDVASGEKSGEIHNYSVTAHIAEEGLYLEPGGYWYPRVEFSEKIDPNNTLADYKLSVQPVADFEMVAGVQRDDVRKDGALQWSSPFPLEGLVLARRAA